MLIIGLCVGLGSLELELYIGLFAMVQLCDCCALVVLVQASGVW